MKVVLVLSYLYLAFVTAAHSNIQRRVDSFKLEISDSVKIFDTEPKPFWERKY